MKHSQEFIDWYNTKYGVAVQVTEFDRFNNNSFKVTGYKSHMSMMPSVVQERFKEWCWENADYCCYPECDCTDDLCASVFLI